jgi:hypothetical protein
MQLRKDRQHPYYHEYIVVFTGGGHTYRIDRRPDADTAFNTIMKEGCTAYDTIEEVHSNSLDGTSDCVVELHWQGDQTIDLLFVLSICFRTHNDKWTKRYTLQHYNCYFVSWTIIMIIVRGTTACRDGLKTALEHGIWPERLRNWKGRRLNQALDRVLGLESRVKMSLERARNREWDLEQKLKREMEKNPERDHELEQDHELEREWEQQQERQRQREPERWTRVQRRKAWSQEPMGEWASLIGTGWRQRREREREQPEREQWERQRKLASVRMRELKLELVQAQALERQLVHTVHARERKRAQLVQVLARVPLVLCWRLLQDWRLLQGWKYAKANVQQKLRELLRDANSVFLPGEREMSAMFSDR